MEEPLIEAPTPDAIARAARSLQAGELVGMPTETVYGLAADALSAEAVAKVFEAKARPSFDPLIVHLAPDAAITDIADLSTLGPLAQERVKRLQEAFWPGPLTLVLPRQSRVPDLVTAGLDTVGVRVPAHPVAQALLKAAGPLAAPSANRFGRVSPTTASAVVAELGDATACVLDGGPCEVGVESTVVRIVASGDVTLLRHGGVGADALEAVLGSALLHPGRDTDATPASPGRTKSHYAPRTPLHLLPGPLTTQLWSGADKSKAIAVLFWTTPTEIPADCSAHRVLAEDGTTRRAAQRLFAALRELDALGVDLILAEPCPSDTGLGPAIADRLRRASA